MEACDATCVAAIVLITLAVAAANLPWLSERIFFLFPAPSGGKRAWMRLLEWLVLYAVVGVLAFGLERRLTGETHAQDWEFYAVTACLFVVFALPGFIYRHDLRRHLDRRG